MSLTGALTQPLQRAREAGIEVALHGQSRRHWPASKYTGEVEAHLVATACLVPPDGHPHQTLALVKSLVQKLNVSSWMTVFFQVRRYLSVRLVP